MIECKIYRFTYLLQNLKNTHQKLGKHYLFHIRQVLSLVQMTFSLPLMSHCITSYRCCLSVGSQCGPLSG